MWPSRNGGYVLLTGYMPIRRECRLHSSHRIYPGPIRWGHWIYLFRCISKSSGYNLSYGYNRMWDLYFLPFRLSSCHVRPISYIRQILGFPPDASRLVFFSITIVPRQIFSHQIRLALRRRAHIVRASPFLIKVPSCVLGPTHSCNDMMAH